MRCGLTRSRYSSDSLRPTGPDGGWDIDQTVHLAAILRTLGVDLIDVSSGGAVSHQNIITGPGYQVPFAAAVKDRADIPVSAVGLITGAAQAEDIVASHQADAVMLGRAAIREPSWPLRAAHELGIRTAETPYPPQHARGAWGH